MAINNPNDGSSHPEDMLEAFALNALDLDEEEQVQDHLDGCDLCSGVVARYQETAASLAQSVDSLEPPPVLRARLMQAVSRQEPQTPQDPEPRLVPALGDRMIDNRLARMMIPMAGGVAMVLVVLAVAMSIRVSGQVDDLKQENADLQARLDASIGTMTVQMASAATAESSVMDSAIKVQQAIHQLAEPDNMSLELNPPSAGSRSQGVLLVSSDGSRGVIMVAGMEPPNPSTTYHIWLMRGQDKVWAGKLDVDSVGAGTVTLQLSEPIMGFEKVELTANADPRAPQVPSDMVLQGDLVSMNSSNQQRFVIYSPWR